MKRIYLLLITFVFVSLALNTVRAQVAEDYDSLDIYIRNSAELFKMPGIAIGIIKDNDVVFEKAYGFSNTEKQTPVDKNTQFAIASCTKAFTAAALAILVDEGKINWDDRVVDHYPEFQMYDPYVTSEMQIADLACHRSGLQTFDGDLLWYGSDYNREEVVHRIRNRESTYSFRSHFGYQNVMFIAAGEVIEKVTGTTWDDFVKTHIFTPLGMDKTNTSITDLDFSGNVAWPHIDGKPIDFINYDNVGPAASINTSVDDLLKWVQLMLHKGMKDSLQIFSEKQYYNLVGPHTIINAGKAETVDGTHFFDYALGWFTFDYAGRKVIEHGGGLPGFHSKVVFIPEENLGYVILANQISGMVEAIYKKILDFYLTDSKKDWAKLYYEGQQKMEQQKEAYLVDKEKERATDTQPSLRLSEYAGIYEDNMYGKAEVTFENDNLKVTLLPTKKLFTAELKHWQYDTFNFRFNDPYLPEGFLTFYIDQDAKPSYFTIELKNPDFHFYKLKFEKTD